MQATRHHATTLVAIAVAIGASGCANRAQPVRPYVPPAEGTPSARLLMRGTIAAGGSYGVFVMADDCTQPRRVGLGNAQTNPAFTRIPADALSTLEVLIMKPDKNIYRVRLSFQPVAGHSYVVTPRSSATAAGALLFDATQPDAWKLEPTLRRRDVDGNLCVAWANAKPIRVTTQDGTADLPIPKPNVPDDLSGLVQP